MIQQLSFNIAVDLTGMIGLVFMLFSLADTSTRKIPKARKLLKIILMLMFILFSDMVVSLYLGKPNVTVLLNVASTANHVAAIMLMLEFIDYWQKDFDTQKNKWNVSVHLLMNAGVLMIFFTLTNPMHQLFFSFIPQAPYYQRGKLFALTAVFPIVSLIYCILLTASRKSIHWKTRLTVISYCLLPLVTGFMQLIFQGFSLVNMGMMTSVLIMFVNYYLEQSKEAAKTELELQNARSALVLSQIQPHFLFNSMTAIMDLCSTDPAEAQAALQELSDYLHYKIYAMSHSFVVPFSEDMEFLQNYVKLEKRRFLDRLNIEYDIQAVDFRIPLLTLQPLVENSIRHGISKRPSGGTIWVCTSETADGYAIRIEDNGIGFDPSQIQKESREHVGLANVKTRVEALCGGTLTIHSSPRMGTQVEIIIPKETQEDTK